MLRTPVYWLHGRRHRGGMNSIQAYLWNRGSLANMQREEAQVGQTLIRLETEDLQDGGLLRSSDETSVMGVERRG